MNYLMKIPVAFAAVGLVLCTVGCTQKLQSENVALKENLTQASLQIAKLSAQYEAAQARIGDLQKAIAAAETEKKELCVALAAANKMTDDLRENITKLQATSEIATQRAVSLEQESVENRRGDLVGAVGYYFNDNYGIKPDAGSTIYIFKKDDYPVFDAGLLSKFLTLKASNASASQEMGNQKSFQHMLDVSLVGEKTIKLSADGSGAFRIRMRPGHYAVVTQSAHRTGNCLVEILGQLSYQEVDVSVGDQANVAATFYP